MLKEYKIDFKSEDTITRLSDRELSAFVIEGPGGVTLGEVMSVALMAVEMKIPENIIKAACVDKGSTQKWAIRKCAEDWNGIVDDEQMVHYLKKIMLGNLCEAISITDATNIRKVVEKNLKQTNLGIMLDVLSTELGGPQAFRPY